MKLAMKLFKSEWYQDAMELLLDSFMTVLGPTGTLIVPTFNYDFVKVFHIIIKNPIRSWKIY